MNEALSYHGIKGQKWGVRRQEKINAYARVVKSQDPSLSDEKAKKIAKKEINANRRHMIVAGTVLASAAAYLAYKKGVASFDQYVKPGTLMQRVSDLNDNPSSMERFYATANKLDNFTYLHLFKEKNGSGARDIIKQATVDKPLKIASDRTARKIFNQTVGKDIPETKMKERLATFFLNGTDSNKYYNFNTYGFMGDTKKDRENVKRFTEIMKAKGYDGIRDVNDATSGFGSNPLILFGEKSISQASKLTPVKSLTFADDPSSKNARKKVAATAIVMGRAFTRSPMLMAVPLTSLASSVAYNSQINMEIKKQQSKKED